MLSFPYISSPLKRILGANDLDYFLRENDERHFSYPSQTIDQPGTFEKILQEQQNIIQSEYDLKVLKHAMRAFHSLKSVHILQSAGDKAIDHRRIFVIGRPDSPDYAYSCWVPACRRAMETVLEALRYGKPPIDSFRCPGLSPQGLSQLPHEIQGNAISSVSNTLRCLELHFDSRVHSTLVSSTILSPSLPEVLRRIFSAADKLEKLYLGFSSSHPLDVSLESVFHGVTWGKLESIAIDSWVLSAKELVDFLNRHALTLREIRLANIHLREQDRWVRDFVIPLTEICRSNGVLKQITLEDCDYERDFSTTNHFDSEAVNRALGIVSPDSDEEMEETDSIASSTTVHAPFTLDPQESVYSELHAVKLSSKRFTERELAEELDTLLREDTGNPVAHEQRRRWEQCILSSAWG